MRFAFVRRFPLRRGRWFLFGAVVGAALAGGAVTLAAIPDSGGVIHGCYQKNVGNLLRNHAEFQRLHGAA
jgi:gas vesicle protein